MAMNIGGGYSMMGMSPMAGGSAMYGISGNAFQSFHSRYGCEDCFRKQPYPYEFPKPYIEKGNSTNAMSLLQRIINKFTA